MTPPPPPPKPRRFAPLGIDNGGESTAPRLEGIVFDMDGTLCEPQTYMFQEMRNALSIPKSVDILDHIYSLPTPSERDSAMSKIRSIESRAMTAQVPQPGLLRLMTYLESRGISKALCTRNFDGPVNHLLTKFLNGFKFEPIITREFRPPKPAPEGILHIASTWGLDGGEGLIMVGDSIDDMTAGHLAGAATVLLVNDVNAHLAEHEHTDLCIIRLDELVEIFEKGFVGVKDSEVDTRERAEKVLRDKEGEIGGG